MESIVENRTIQKVTRRFVYLISFAYFLAFIDRANVAVAALRMNTDLKFSGSIYGLGAGLFFLAYAIFEVPSNLVLYRVGARRWLTRIMVTWGIISACFSLVQGPHSFYILRFLLGAAEAGFFPGLVYYLTLWFPSQHRIKPMSILLSCPMLALILMGPVSSWLMGVTHGLGGIPGWRWMFLIEGIPTAIVGIIMYFYLEDRPEAAAWLTAEEKGWLCDALAESHRETASVEHHSVGSFLSDSRIWILTFIYFLWCYGGYGIMFWLPLIMKSAGKFSNMQIGLLYSIPFICGFICILTIGPHSDRTGERKWHIVICSLCAFVSLTASAFVGSPILAFILICICAGSIWGMQPVFWALPADYLGGQTAAAGIAMVNCVAGVGGFLAPYVVGIIKDKTGKFGLGMVAMAVGYLVMAVVVMAIKVPRVAVVKPVQAMAADPVRP